MQAVGVLVYQFGAKLSYDEQSVTLKKGSLFRKL
jgi:hypothetical protein